MSYVSQEKISQYLFYALVITVPLFFTWLTHESFYLPKRFLFQSIIAIIFLYAIILSVRKGIFLNLHLSTVRRQLIPVLLFSFWGLLSLFNSINIHVSLRYYSFFFPQVGLFFLTVYLLNNPPYPPLAKGGERRDFVTVILIEKVLNVLIIVGTISALLGILQFVGLDYEHCPHTSLWPPRADFILQIFDLKYDCIRFSIPQRLPDKTAIYSTYGNPNFMSSFLIAVVPVALMNLWHYFYDIKKRYKYSIAVFILIFCILISRTKGAWLGLFVSIIVLLILIVKSKGLMPSGYLKKYLKFSVVVVAALAIFAAVITIILPIGSNPIVAELSPITRSHLTIKGRELMWGTTLNMIKDHPLIGLGVNTFRLNYQHYQGAFLKENPEYIPYLGSAESPHNQYLEIAAEQGIIGLLLFLWINIVFFKVGINIIRSESGLKEKAVTIGILAAVAATLVHALVEFPFNLVPNAMLYYLYLGIVMVIANKPLKSFKLFKPFKPLASAMTIIITAFLSFIFIFQGIGPVIASKIHKDAWYLMRDMRYNEVIPLAKKGVKLDPLNDELHLFLGVANYQLGNYNESLKEYKKAYELYPDYMIPFNIGLIYKRLGDLKPSEEYFKKTIFLRPNLPEAYLKLSEIYREMGRVEDSVEMMNNAEKYKRF
ncbi:MAG: O-antigen ligase family protein [Nitrospirae bacterium]|nr:O-antigen ligase family protein [Nitrospirota bacterium]